MIRERSRGSRSESESKSRSESSSKYKSWARFKSWSKSRSEFWSRSEFQIRSTLYSKKAARFDLLVAVRSRSRKGDLQDSVKRAKS